MKIKALLGISLISIFSQAYATCGGNFYAGPFIGIGIIEGKISTQQQGIVAPNIPIIRANKLGENSFLGGAMIGYLYHQGHYSLGAEILGNFDTINDKFLHEDAGGVIEKFHLKQKHQLGFAARFGYGSPSGPRFYVRLGGEWSTYQLRYTMHSTIIPAPAYSKKKTQSLFHFVPGVGIEMPLSHQWRIRLEGKYALTRTIKMRIPEITGGVATFSHTHVRLKPRRASIVLGVTYSFEMK